MKQIILKDNVKDTYTNAEGASLSIQLKEFIKSGERIELSLSNSTPISSSFFNSSFGDLIETFGYEAVRENIKITGVTSSQAQLLKGYFDAYKDRSHC